MAGQIIEDEEKRRFDEKIALLEATFGGTVSSVVITSVLESCDGDVNVAADAIMSFDNETTSTQAEGASNEGMDIKNEDYNVVPIQIIPAESTAPQQPPITESPISISSVIPVPSVSFSEAFRNTGAVPKRYSETRMANPQYRSNGPPDQIARIIDFHNQGTRTIILMRGASGSGKTYLAKHIIDYTVGALSQNYSRHIFSTDNYFMRGGIYQYNRNYLDEAHMTNQKNVCDAANKGLSPIIVDNTNTELWEMEPYVRDGVRNGYIIEIMEPNTPWARNANQLSKKNTHGVPRDNIRRMLDRYDRYVTVEYIMKTLRLAYPVNKKPPVMRDFPQITPPESFKKSVEKNTLNKVDYNKDNSCPATSGSKEIFHLESPHSPDELFHKLDINDTACISSIIEKMPCDDAELIDPEDEVKLQKIIEAQQNIEKFEEVEKEWENGESWENLAGNDITISRDQAVALDPKPPRDTEKNDPDKLIQSANICDDWTKISMFMPPWQDVNDSNSAMIAKTPTQVETQNASTSFELGDFNENIHKVLYGKSVNINATQYTNIPSKKKKIAKVVALDKSTTTHENVLLVETEECKYKENHFIALRRMFKIVPSHILRDIFDSCNGDVNWAVNIVLDSYPESQAAIGRNEVSDSEEEPIEGCPCLAAYNIIPDVLPTAPISLVLDKIPQTSTTPLFQKKTKRDNNIILSDSSMELKRQIESNIMISDNHYSQHYLNTRRRRENFTNEFDKASGSATTHANIEDVTETKTSVLDKLDSDNTALLETLSPNNYNDVRDTLSPSTSHHLQLVNSIPNDSDTEINNEQMVSMNMGVEFVTKLNELFGDQRYPFPEYVQPTLDLPISVLRDIYDYWYLSVVSQIDDNSWKQSDAMIKQDEEFARQLAAKEEEMAKEGKEPDIPTLKEIMDMEKAYAIYEMNVAEWRNNEPQDLAAKLSRDKLYNLFPDLAKDVLSEVLMAHDYSFKDTVEGLLVSTGQGNWLQNEKGVEKFVMRKEMERKEKFIEEQNKSLSDVEWPVLSEKPINLETVNHYRAEAQKYLQYRNKNFERARHYFTTNYQEIASFYSSVAAMHTKMYEQSSCLAAAYLMNYHLRKNPDKDVLDLHFLHVSEAMVNLDIFLDQIILNLRNRNNRRKEALIITGKGAHSTGGPRIKPATKRRLKARDIKCKEVNAGLLMAQLHPTHKMTSELAQSEN